MFEMSSRIGKVLLVWIVLFSLCINACGGRAINKNSARALIANSPLAPFETEDVYVDSVNQTGARDAIVEARLKAAFRFEKVHGQWVIKEVRLGDRPWESVDDVLKALQVVKTDETRNSLERIAAALEAYRARNGRLPDFRDYVTLSDKLYPNYLNPLIRVDAWENPLAAFAAGPDSVRLVSPGPDGKLGSADDIQLVRSFSVPEPEN
jgi:hypothetical protein